MKKKQLPEEMLDYLAYLLAREQNLEIVCFKKTPKEEAEILGKEKKAG